MGRKKSAPRADHMAVFGNVAIPRANCPRCGDMALVIDGKMACCDAPFLAQPTAVHYETSYKPFRQKPPAEVQEQLLSKYNNRCAYCDQAFGDLVRLHNGQHAFLRLSWDHFIPFIWTHDNSDANFLPSCHVCNSRKRDKVFNDLEAAREWLLETWRQ